MPTSPDPVPLLLGEVLAAPCTPRLRDMQGQLHEAISTELPGRFSLPPGLTGDFWILSGPGQQVPRFLRRGGWQGKVTSVLGGVICGWARDMKNRTADVAVIAVAGDSIVTHAVAHAAEGGRFVMILPAAVTGSSQRLGLTLGILGSDHVLEGGQVVFSPTETATGTPHPRGAMQDLAIRIKISTPNLREAPLWGDYHFANSLAAAFERRGVRANVDTADMWYSHGHDEDVVIKIRGRHRLQVDPRKVNIMWLISHPDRIRDREYDDFDHIFVASDVYARELADKGLRNVSVMHQAADIEIFQNLGNNQRLQRCLFVGNSRSEYRRMVKWSLRSGQPFDLYGGGWDGVLSPSILRAPSVRNSDLPALYGNYLLLLNDHWDSMRDNGFLSNRLFDGSAVATPILSDPVQGLEQVFGDTVTVAKDSESFRRAVVDCLANPTVWQEKALRACGIVQSAHSFDHRALELSQMIGRIVARRRM